MSEAGGASLSPQTTRGVVSPDHNPRLPSGSHHSPGGRLLGRVSSAASWPWLLSSPLGSVLTGSSPLGSVLTGDSPLGSVLTGSSPLGSVLTWLPPPHMVPGRRAAQCDSALRAAERKPKASGDRRGVAVCTSQGSGAGALGCPKSAQSPGRQARRPQGVQASVRGKRPHSLSCVSNAAAPEGRAGATRPVCPGTEL